MAPSSHITREVATGGISNALFNGLIAWALLRNGPSLTWEGDSSFVVDIFATAAAPSPPASVDPLAALENLPVAERPAFEPVTKLDTTGLDEICERYVVASEKYIEQRLLLSALDACMEVIRLNPDYLPTVAQHLAFLINKDGSIAVPINRNPNI